MDSSSVGPLAIVAMITASTAKKATTSQAAAVSHAVHARLRTYESAGRSYPSASQVDVSSIRVVPLRIPGRTGRNSKVLAPYADAISWASARSAALVYPASTRLASAPAPDPLPVRHSLQTLASPWALRAAVVLALGAAAAAAVTTCAGRDDGVVSGQSSSEPSPGNGTVSTVSRGSRAPVLGAAVNWDLLRRPGAYRRLFLDHYRSLTPENAMKMDALAPAPDRFDFSEADAHRALRPAPRDRRSRAHAGLGQAAARLAHGARLDARTSCVRTSSAT